MPQPVSARTSSSPSLILSPDPSLSPRVSHLAQARHVEGTERMHQLRASITAARCLSRPTIPTLARIPLGAAHYNCLVFRAWGTHLLCTQGGYAQGGLCTMAVTSGVIPTRLSVLSYSAFSWLPAALARALGSSPRPLPLSLPITISLFLPAPAPAHTLPYPTHIPYH